MSYVFLYYIGTYVSKLSKIDLLCVFTAKTSWENIAVDKSENVVKNYAKNRYNRIT